MRTLILLLLASQLSWSGDLMTCKDTVGQKKWDDACLAQAKSYLEQDSQSSVTQAHCAQLIPQKKGQSSRCQWYPMRLDHVPGFIAEAFHSGRRDHRELALDYLFRFCSLTPETCRPYYGQVDGEVKTAILTWKKTLPDLAHKAKKLKDSIRAQASVNDEIFHPWGKNNAEMARAFLVENFKHVLLMQVEKHYWSPEKGQSSSQHFQGRIVKVYKGDWKISEPISLVHYVDSPPLETEEAKQASLLFVFTNDHNNRKITVDTGEFLIFDKDLEPALNYFYPNPRQ